jgi:hypothetical protein
MILACACAMLVTRVSTIYAQEEQETISVGKKYIEWHVNALDKYAQRAQQAQRRLLNRLARKEKQFAKKLGI